MSAFNKVFISEGFNFNSTSRGHITLEDKPAGLKFKTSLNQDQSMCFLFQKKHTSHRDKAFSIRTRMELDSKPPLRFVNSNYFNFAQDLSSFDDIEALYLQNKLVLKPENNLRGELNIKPEFSQALLLKFRDDWFLGAQMKYLTEKSFSLIGFHQSGRLKGHFSITPFEKKGTAGGLYLTKKNEIVGFNASYDMT